MTSQAVGLLSSLEVARDLRTRSCLGRGSGRSLRRRQLIRDRCRNPRRPAVEWRIDSRSRKHRDHREYDEDARQTHLVEDRGEGSACVDSNGDPPTRALGKRHTDVAAASGISWHRVPGLVRDFAGAVRPRRERPGERIVLCCSVVAAQPRPVGVFDMLIAESCRSVRDANTIRCECRGAVPRPSAVGEPACFGREG
jgi:hypothetical protein